MINTIAPSKPTPKLGKRTLANPRNRKERRAAESKKGK
jgi:hypothetical protein